MGRGRVRDVGRYHGDNDFAEPDAHRSFAAGADFRRGWSYAALARGRQSTHGHAGSRVNSKHVGVLDSAGQQSARVSLEHRGVRARLALFSAQLDILDPAATKL